ncbi:MAG: flavodoxin family protein [Geobacteraceae bacterium]|nr:flavodoxin family protein [Geobacteraceae bacterium]
MKVVAFSGSARWNGNTAILIGRVFEKPEKEGIEIELIQMAGERISGCTACLWCKKTKDGTCVLKDDPVDEWINKCGRLTELFWYPTYFADISSERKALIDRSGYLAKANGEVFRRKVNAAVIAARRGGAIHSSDTINHFFLISQKIVPGSFYWNVGIGREIGEVEQDLEGIETMQVLGENVAWLLKKVYTP